MCMDEHIMHISYLYKKWKIPQAFLEHTQRNNYRWLLRIPKAQTWRHDRSDLTVMTDECSNTCGSRELVGPGPDPPATDNAAIVTQPQKQWSYWDRANKQKAIDIEYYLNFLNGKDHGPWYYSFASPSKMKVGVWEAHVMCDTPCIKYDLHCQ